MPERTQYKPINSFYHNEIPGFILPFIETEEMKRLTDIGMNCGCEYTGFSMFRNLPRYTRFNHSLGCALIVWHFTSSREQAISALFHDIATPTFAHTVDFMKGDYLNQNITEEGTDSVIENSPQITELLNSMGIPAGRVSNYHIYPIADNNSPKLSADRLEYTLGNLRNYGLKSERELKRYYDNLSVSDESGEDELIFQDLVIAEEFTRDALKCSKVYVSDEDRYSMQMLSEILKYAVDENIISISDLYQTETSLIDKLKSRDDTNEMWKKFVSLKEITFEDNPDSRIVYAKKRFIDPYVAGVGRLSENNAKIKEEIQNFVNQSQDYPICGK